MLRWENYFVMKTVASWFVFFALCDCDSILEKKERYVEVERFDELGYVARRQLEYMFEEFAKVIHNRHAPKDAVNDLCIHDERIGNVRAVTECASSVFKDYMGTMIKYDIFKDRYSKRELFKAFRKYLAYMRNHRLFGRDGNIPLADCLTDIKGIRNIKKLMIKMPKCFKENLLEFMKVFYEKIASLWVPILEKNFIHMRNTAGLLVLFGLCYLNDAYVKDLNDFDDTGHIARRQLAALFTEFRKIIESCPYIPDDIVNDKCIHDESNNEMGDVRECGESVLKEFMNTIVRYDVFRDQGKKREFYKHFKGYMQFMRGHKSFGLDAVIPGAGTYKSMMIIEQENRHPPQPFESIEWTTPSMDY